MERTQTKSERGSFSLPFSFFAGPATWALQLLIGYGLSAQACLAGSKLSIYLLSGAAALVVLVSGILAYRNWHSYAANRTDERGGESRGMLVDTEASISRQEFVAISGALLSSVFFLLVLATGVAMFFLSPCPVITQPLP